MKSIRHSSLYRVAAWGLCCVVACVAHAASVAPPEPGSSPVAVDYSIPAVQRFASATGETPDFQRHVLPLLGRLGCNGRACHGSFQGQGGFRLSLFGYDFKADLEQLTSDKTFDGKPRPDGQSRINRAQPHASLLLRKPTLAVEHEGGERFKPDSWQHRLLLRWIESGAPGLTNSGPTKASPKFEKLVVEPREIVFQRPGETVRLRATAHWSDGAREDVTCLSRFRSNDDSVATVDDDGLVTCKTPGGTHVVAFYDLGVQPVQTLLPVSKFVGPNYPAVPTPTKVDELVVHKLRPLGIIPSDLCTDAEFLRRASLDITGTLPAPAEVTAFLADTSRDKRDRKIDELLERPGYAAWWATKLCDFTGNNAKLATDRPLGDQQAKQWYEWVHKRVRENAPYDEIVAGMVLATGRLPDQSYEQYCQEMSSYFRASAPADMSSRPTMPLYWMQGRNGPQAKENALRFGYAFLGVRLQCAECHKHPFDQWTKDDFDQFTKFFAAIAYAPPQDARQDFEQQMTKLTGGQKGGQAQKAVNDALKDGKNVPWREVAVLRDRLGQAVARPANDGAKPKPKTPDAKQQAKQKAKEQRRNPQRVLEAQVLGGEKTALVAGKDPRQPLMEWLREKDNPYFARAFVNRVWAAYFGVGIVDPPDDLNLANPPSNAELLDYLADGFVARRYDMKWLHREIAKSRTYQLSWQVNATNALDERFFSHALPRRLPAEVLYDAIQTATLSDAAAGKFVTDHAARAIGPTSGYVRNPKGQFALTVFGKPPRETNCDCERSTEPSLLQTLFLRNDNDVSSMIDRQDGWLADMTRQLGEPVRAPAPNNDPQRAQGKGAPKSPPEDRAEILQQIKQAEQRVKKLRDEGNKEQADKLQQRIKRLQNRLELLGRLPPGATLPAAKQPGAKQQARGRFAPPEPNRAQPPPAPVKKADDKDVYQMIQTLYLRTVSRPATTAEVQRIQRHLADSKSRSAGLRDTLWALLNGKEFVLNH